jgi:hypothetical protein
VPLRKGPPCPIAGPNSVLLLPAGLLHGGHHVLIEERGHHFAFRGQIQSTVVALRSGCQQPQGCRSVGLHDRFGSLRLDPGRLDDRLSLLDFCFLQGPEGRRSLLISRRSPVLAHHVGCRIRPRSADGHLDRPCVTRTWADGYPGEDIDRPHRCVTSHQYSPAVISPARGNIAVSGSAAHRTKNTKKFSAGGPESGPLLFHCSHVNGTNTSARSSSPTRQALNAVNGLHKESRNRQGRKRNIVTP